MSNLDIKQKEYWKKCFEEVGYKYKNLEKENADLKGGFLQAIHQLEFATWVIIQKSARETAKANYNESKKEFERICHGTK